MSGHFAGVVALIALLSISSEAHSQATTSNWLQYKYGAERNSFSPNEENITTETVGTLSPIWNFNEAPNSYAKSITVQGKSLYYITSISLSGFSTIDGSLQRQYDGSWRDQASAVSGRTIFHVSGNSIWSTDTLNGQLTWSKDVGFVADPIMYWNKLLFVDNTSGLLTVLNSADGSIKWRRNFGAGRIPACITAQTLYIATYSGQYFIRALDALTGTLKWSKVLSYPASDLACFAGNVYVPADKLYVFRGANSRPIASIDGRFRKVAVSDGQIVVTTDNSEISSFSLTDRKPLWTISLPGTQSYASSPIIAGGVIYSARSEGLFAVRATDGATLWQYGPERAWKDVVVSGGALFANNEDGELQAFGLKPSTGE